MAGDQHEFGDSESASFLHGDVRARSEKDRRLLDGQAALWKLSPTLSRFLPYILVALGMVAGILLTLVLLAFSSSTLNPNSSSSKGESLQTSQTMLGKIPKKLVTFNADESYDVDPLEPDQVREGVWSKLAPPGKGHIRVENPAAWGLKGGFPLKDDPVSGAEEYTISLFHQIHCLAAMQSKMTLLSQWFEETNDKSYLQVGLSQVPQEHIYHCFDYIRQAILCSGDTTLEKARTVDGETKRGVDGWGVAHECRDFDAIYSFAVAHRSSNMTGVE